MNDVSLFKLPPPETFPELYELLLKTKVKFKIIAKFTNELLKIVDSAPTLEHKEKYVHQYLDCIFENIDFNETFDTRFYVIIQDVITVEILLSMQSWFNNKCCNMKNIWMIQACALGIKTWYNNYVSLMGIGDRSLTMVEFPIARNMPRIGIKYNKNNSDSSRKIENYFTTYCGTYGSEQRDFYAALFLRLKKHGLVDYLGGFKQALEVTTAKFEHYTNFANNCLVNELINETKHTFNSTGIKNEMLGATDGFQAINDKKHLLHLIRETLLDTPWTTISEKTLTPIVHKQILIPVSGTNSVEYIEELGFVFDKKIFDYSYQTEPNFANRCIKIYNNLDKFIKTHSLESLNDYLHENKELFEYNYYHLVSGAAANRIKLKFLKEIDNE